MRNLSNFIPRRYHYVIYLICFIYLLIFLFYSHPSVELSEEQVSSSSSITIIQENDPFDLYDDDDEPLTCPPDLQFKISNRQYLAVIVALRSELYVWINFRALLCTGIDTYVIFDQVFNISSTSRIDGYSARKKRSKRSYTHRFIYITDKELDKYGVIYMVKYPRTKYSAWDRAVVWLYHRKYLTNAWLMDSGVQWFDVHNMTYLFDLFSSDTSDLLCADIITGDSTFWTNWPKNQSDIFPRQFWLGTYSPLVRWSRHLLLHHYKYMQLMHKDRLLYEINTDFRFKEFLMGTIAKTESLTVALYNQRHHFVHLSLTGYNDKSILQLLQEGKHIIYPVLHDSILTKYEVKQIAAMMNNNDLRLSQDEVVTTTHTINFTDNTTLQFNQTHTFTSLSNITDENH